MRTSLLLSITCALLAGAQNAPKDGRADALLAEATAASRGAQTLAADLEVSWKTPGKPLRKSAGTVRLMKPNFARVVVAGDYDDLDTLASDGRTVYTLHDPTRYTKAAADPQGKNVDSPWWALPVRHFFTQSVNPFGPAPDATAKTRYVGEEIVEGETFQVVEVAGEKPMPYVARFHVGADRLIRRSVVEFGQGERGASFRAKLTNVRVDQRMSKSSFRYAPPATARPDDLSAKLLPVGQAAPQFTLPTPDGGTIALDDVRKGRKATLINFWYVNCPPCRREFPVFQSLYAKLKDRGFAVVAINRGDTGATRPRRSKVISGKRS
ncbi:MAG TPA: redoxin domain-containing protein [Pyrinomonadaceae bacterium]|jgi:thiol-disulfide isomerase/thioredoxin|nr:redoxin domain-containing protein [Pyrinomonadaceae bacterium]